MAHGEGEFTPVASHLADRYHLMTYLTVVSRESLIFCLKEPHPVLRWEAFVFPLSLTVWILQFSSLGVFMIVFSLMVTLKLKSRQNFSIPVFQEEGIFLPLALFLEHNIRVPIENPVRIAAISIIVLAFVVGMFYKSNLVGYITFPEKQSIPRTFKQLYEHKDFKINLYSFSPAEMAILNASPSPIFKAIVKRINASESLETCLKSATKYRTVCIIWRSIGTTEIMKESATFPALNSLFFTQDEAFAVGLTTALKKNSIYYETLNRYSGATYQAGLFMKWMKDEMAFEREKARNELKKKSFKKYEESKAVNSEVTEHQETGMSKHSQKPLKVEHLKAIAYGFLIGWVFSFIVFIIEGIVKVVMDHINVLDMAVNAQIIEVI